jgi:IclR-like helix-turn-helix domain-containing protein
MPDKKNRRPGTPTSSLEGLSAFSHRDWALPLAEIARRSGMPKSTAHRVLAMLFEHWQIPLDQWTAICTGAGHKNWPILGCGSTQPSPMLARMKEVVLPAEAERSEGMAFAACVATILGNVR